MSLSETVLFALAKKLYSDPAPAAASDSADNAEQNRRTMGRTEEFDIILEATRHFDMDCKGKSILDFGCASGHITKDYLSLDPAQLVGVDISEDAVSFAKEHYVDEKLAFRLGSVSDIPVDDESIDVAFSFDVFEHVSDIDSIVAALHRVIKPGGHVLIGICGGWHHPFAPHHRSVMPVPWAHVFFSEKTFMRVCRKVYQSDWYTARGHELDENGNKRDDKYVSDAISTDYLNKFLLKDFEAVFERSPFTLQSHYVPLAKRYAAATGPLMAVPFLREFFTGYAWFQLSKK
jgi:SAM-dependent methyltransferase